MKNIAILLISLFMVSACAIKEPRVAFGKKCEQNGDKITYSYVWVYDKNIGLPANEEQCAALPQKEKK
jgi:hypothetical protein